MTIPPTWTRVADLADFGGDELLRVKLGDADIALYKADRGILATAGLCTHGHAYLADGLFDPESCIIECPLHAGRFDVKTGKGQGAPIDKDLDVFEVKVEGGDILAKLPG